MIPRTYHYPDGRRKRTETKEEFERRRQERERAACAESIVAECHRGEPEENPEEAGVSGE